MRSLVICITIVFLFFSVRMPVLATGSVVINEFLPHPSSGNKEWVELYSSDETDITNYWIDDDTDFVDDSGSSRIKQITAIEKGVDGKHVVFVLPSSIFNNTEDTIALFTPGGKLIDKYHYVADPGIDISIGRTPDAIGDFDVLAYATRGSTNGPPKPTATPTPEPTEKPTSTPKPTKVPTSTPTKIISDLQQDTPSVINQTMVGTSEKYRSSSQKISSMGAQPTSILGAKTKAIIKKASSGAQKTLVQSSSTVTDSLVAISFGGLFLLSCGILMYLKKLKVEK